MEEGDGVTQAEVFEVFGKNVGRLRELVASIIAALPAEREDDLCAHALDGIKLPINAALTRLSRHPQTSQAGHFTNYRRGVWSVRD